MFISSRRNSNEQRSYFSGVRNDELYEFDNVVVVASTFEKAVELLVEHLRIQVYRPERVDLMQGKDSSEYHNTGIDQHSIVEATLDSLYSSNRRTDMPVFLDNQKVIEHSFTTEFQKNGGYFTVDAVQSLLETYEQWKYGVAA